MGALAAPARGRASSVDAVHRSPIKGVGVAGIICTNAGQTGVAAITEKPPDVSQLILASAAVSGSLPC